MLEPDRTHIYAGYQRALSVPGSDRLARLAEHLSRDEPDIPSVSIPLADHTDETLVRWWEHGTEALQLKRTPEEIEHESLGLEL